MLLDKFFILLSVCHSYNCTHCRGILYVGNMNHLLCWTQDADVNLSIIDYRGIYTKNRQPMQPMTCQSRKNWPRLVSSYFNILRRYFFLWKVIYRRIFLEISRKHDLAKNFPWKTIIFPTFLRVKFSAEFSLEFSYKKLE
jgi:hypothetical protein